MQVFFGWKDDDVPEIILFTSWKIPSTKFDHGTSEAGAATASLNLIS